MKKNKKAIRISGLRAIYQVLIFFVTLIIIGLLDINVYIILILDIGITAILYFLSPCVNVIVTARYGNGSENDNNNVITAFGKDNTEKKFSLYFQWFNVIHELGHGILRYNNNNTNVFGAEEEQLVNDFALAYWLYYGEEDKINELKEIVEYASNNIKCDINGEEITYMDYAKKHWNEDSFKIFNNYGWFQFNSVKESLHKMKSLEVILEEMGIKNVKLSNPKELKYSIINEETSAKIIKDAVNNFHTWGIKYPKTYQKFSNNPNSNYSVNIKNFLGIYKLVMKLI